MEAYGRQGFISQEQRVSLSGGDSVFLSFVLPRTPDATGTPVAFTEGVPAAFWTEGFFYFSELVIHDAGLPSLRTASFAEGVREVRFWSEVSIGVPKHLVIIRDAHGRLTGEAIRYWPAGSLDEDDHLDAQLTEDLGSTCEQLLHGDDSTVCYGRFVGEPDWSRIMREASEAGLWTLPDPSTLPEDSVWALDGWGMTVELRDGRTYRTYEYRNPGGHAWPEARQAEALADIFGEIWQHVAPQEHPSPPNA